MKYRVKKASTKLTIDYSKSVSKKKSEIKTKSLWILQLFADAFAVWKDMLDIDKPHNVNN